MKPASHTGNSRAATAKTDHGAASDAADFTAKDFDVTRLAFDSAAMLRDLRRWIELESPSYDKAAVERMLDLSARDFALLGAHISRIPGDDAFAGAMIAELPHPDRGAPGILIAGHMDTVHPVGTLAKLAWREVEGRCYGPGIFDMKGGNFLALEAVRQLQRAGIATPLPVTVVFTGDEEVGTPTNRALIEALARRNRYVLVPEPARRDGGVVTGRYAIARFTLRCLGEPSHAGLRLSEGSSAIREMAHQVLRISDLTDAETGFNVGTVQGGQWANCVATECEAKILVSATTDTKLSQATAKLRALTAQDPRVRLVLEEDILRPVWTTSEADWALYHHAAALAKTLGLEIPHQNSGGGSDGNFTGALGVATLDGLGPRGEGPHTLNEHIVIESLKERGELIAGLLATLR